MSTTEPDAYQLLEESTIDKDEIIPNPFFEYPPSYEPLPYKIFKYTIVGVLLLIPRIILTLIVLLFITILYKISSIGLDINDADQSLSKWRRVMISPVSFLVRLMLFFWGFYWISVEGKKITDPSVAPIIVCNHVSFLEPVILCAGYLASPISALENIRYPIISSLLLASRAILIDRTDPQSKKKAKDDIEKRARLALGDKRYTQLLIFPEGTCTNGNVLISYKIGAFSPGVPVQPVCIKFPYKYQSLAWTKDAGNSFLPRFMKMLLQFVNHCEIEYLPPYIPNEEEKADANLYAQNVRNLMADTLNVPITEHSYEDFHLLVVSAKMGIEGVTNNIVFNEMNKLFKLPLNETKELLTRFSKIQTAVPGKLYFEEFCKFFGLPEEPEVEEIFQLFDNNNDGFLDFKEFLIGITSIHMRQKDEKFIEFCFTLFDKDGNGTIGKEEFLAILLKQVPNMSKQKMEEIFKLMCGNSEEISYDQFLGFAKENPVYLQLAKKIVKRTRPEQYIQLTVSGEIPLL